MKKNSAECVEVTFKRASDSRTYCLQEDDGNMVEMIVQLLSLGNVTAVKLEPVRLKLASWEHKGVQRDHFPSNSCHEKDS